MSLEGKQLLDLLDQLGQDTPQQEQMIAAGYFMLKKDGSKRVNPSAFFAALLQAREEQNTEEKKDPSATEQSINVDETIVQTPRETSITKIYGTGIMVCIYELDDEDQFNKFLQLAEDGELDYDDLENGMDEGDQVAALFEPSLIVDDKEINENSSLASLGFDINVGSEEPISLGSYWAVCVESYKGIWGKVEAPSDKVTVPSNYHIFKTDLKLGNGSSALDFAITEVTFMDGEYGDFNEHELEGKSNDWYLIDAEGQVHSV